MRLHPPETTEVNKNCCRNLMCGEGETGSSEKAEGGREKEKNMMDQNDNIADMCLP